MGDKTYSKAFDQFESFCTQDGRYKGPLKSPGRDGSA